MEQTRHDEDYKQRIAASFDRRSDYDDDYTRHRATRLVRFARLAPNDRVLDVATGTGIAAFAAAADVWPHGSVVGIDISGGMLAQARAKLANSPARNVTFFKGDANRMDLAAGSLDAILCSSSLMWFDDIPATLRRWHGWLAPGGTLAFSCYSETSFTIPIQIGVAADFGHSLPNCNEPLGSEARCEALLSDAGFGTAEFEAENLGGFISAQEAKRQWPRDGNWIAPQGNPLSSLPAEELAAMKAAYEARIDELATEGQLRHDIEILYVRARK